MVGIVSREMALDAGQPGLEEERIRCDVCGGSGYVEAEVDDE